MAMLTQDVDVVLFAVGAEVSNPLSDTTQAVLRLQSKRIVQIRRQKHGHPCQLYQKVHNLTMSETRSTMSIHESQLRPALEKVTLYAVKLEKELTIKDQELEKRKQQIDKLKQIILDQKAKMDESSHRPSDQVKDHGTKMKLHQIKKLSLQAEKPGDQVKDHADLSKKASEIVCKFGPKCKFLRMNTCTFSRHDTNPQQPPAQAPSSIASTDDLLQSLGLLRLQVPEELSASIHTNPWSAS